MKKSESLRERLNVLEEELADTLKRWREAKDKEEKEERYVKPGQVWGITYNNARRATPYFVLWHSGEMHLADLSGNNVWNSVKKDRNEVCSIGNLTENQAGATLLANSLEEYFKNKG